MTLSRHPIVEGTFLRFRKGAGADALVRKGALRVTLELEDGSRVNVWNVHLQSRDAGAARAIRAEQISELVHRVEVANFRTGALADGSGCVSIRACCPGSR